MSTTPRKKDLSDEFVRRFIGMCGTANPRVISDHLGISYQAAKNYLNGRLPETKVLIRIGKITGVSIHWLLTGEGDKFVDLSGKTEAELLASTLTEVAEPRILRKMFEVISEERIKAALKDVKESTNAAPRTIKIAADRILKEKESTPKMLGVTKKDR